MVAVKSHQAEAFLKALDKLPSAILFYGSDAGLVAERAASLARRVAERDDPPGEILRMDDTSLEDDPDRLVVELQTLPMFGGRKIVRASTGRRVTGASLKPIVEGGALAGLLIVEAGNLRPDETLRTLFEKSPGAAAVACFPDEARDLDAVVREVLSAAKVEITPGAKRLLLQRLGADRALSRAEIEKLALFAMGKGTIDEDDVDAAVGDAAELALDRVVMAAASGRAPQALKEFDRTIAGGEDGQSVIAAIQRHILRLHRARALVEDGRSMDDALRQMRPPPHFKQRAEIEAQVRGWSLVRLTLALDAIRKAARLARVESAMEDTHAQALILEIAKSATRAPTP